MNPISIDIGKIPELGTQVGTVGALQMNERLTDEVFEFIIGIAALIYELDPRI